jgi:hypothetical protein
MSATNSWWRDEGKKLLAGNVALKNKKFQKGTSDGSKS